MNKYLVYLELEIKRVSRILPQFILGAIVLAGLLGTIALSASKILYSGSTVARIQVGVVMPEDDSLSDLALNMLENMDSVRSLCDFVYLDEEEGLRKLKNGELYGLMLIPQDFVQSIINGTNTPVTIMLPEKPGVETLVFRELTDAGARILGVGQAAIYAADDYCLMLGMPDSISQVEADLNRIFMSYSLTRMEYFHRETVSATGDVSPVQHYAAAGAVLFLLLCGIPASSAVKPESPVFVQKLGLLGIGPGIMIGARILALSGLLLIPAAGMLAAAIWFGAAQTLWAAAGAVALVCLACSCLIILVYELARGQMAGVLLLFFIVFLMVFLSGGFIPSVFLPQGLRRLGSMMPSAWMMGLLKGVFSNSYAAQYICYVLGCCLGGYGAAVWARRQFT